MALSMPKLLPVNTYFFVKDIFKLSLRCKINENNNFKQHYKYHFLLARNRLHTKN